jgi:hypothetical protein
MTDDQAAHAESFGQLAKNLAKIGAALHQQHPEVGREFIGRAFLIVAITMLLDAGGPEKAGTYLMDLAKTLLTDGELPPGGLN